MWILLKKNSQANIAVLLKRSREEIAILPEIPTNCAWELYLKKIIIDYDRVSVLCVDAERIEVGWEKMWSKPKLHNPPQSSLFLCSALLNFHSLLGNCLAPKLVKMWIRFFKRLRYFPIHKYKERALLCKSFRNFQNDFCFTDFLYTCLRVCSHRDVFHRTLGRVTPTR